MATGREMDVEIKRVKEQGCRKTDCRKCHLYTKECVYNFLDKVHKWQAKQHQKIGEMLRKDTQ